jgi:hypothetical protein
MGLRDVTAESVLAALTEYDQLGDRAFREHYGFRRARLYHIVHEGFRYDSKAIMGAAHKYATGRVLPSDEFSGGARTVGRRLSQLGFTVENWQAARVTDSRQPLLLIAPCYGNPASRARFAATLLREVTFTAPPVADCLSDDELAMLLRLHPGGSARFWGALSSHDSKMARLATGDPILFTGASQVQAIGAVGCLLTNKTLADVLWVPGDAGSWTNVYSVLDFRQTRGIAYGAIRAIAGYSPKDVFRATRVTSSEQAASLIAGLGLDATDHEQQDQQAADALLSALGVGSTVVDAEANNIPSTQYERPAGTVIVRRAEAELVARYRQTLADSQAKRLRLAGGWSDLYAVADADLIEAKSDSTHRYVRQALGQLLDYAANATQPVRRLTALFPRAPAPADIRLLHVYGIDCLYWTGGSEFHRIEAPEPARLRISTAWTSQ